MGLSLFGTNHSVETDRSLKPTHDELVIRVTVLAGEIARLSREVTELKRTNGATSVATNGPIPTSSGTATSGRALMRLIGTRLGKNEDSVRKALVTGARFQTARDHSALQGLPITRNMPMLKTLADSPKLAELFA